MDLVELGEGQCSDIRHGLESSLSFFRFFIGAKPSLVAFLGVPFAFLNRHEETKQFSNLFP